MKTVRNYMMARFFGATLFTLACLLGLYGFFDIIREVPDLGKGSYQTGTMLAYVALQIPGHAYELMPLAVLIGALVAMSQLSGSAEYTAIRTFGVSLGQIARFKLIFGLIMALSALALGEFISPQSEQMAERLKLQSTRSLIAQEFRSGLWVKDDNNMINVREMLPDNTLLGIRIYSYDDEYRLIRSEFAERATYQGAGKWQLEGVRSSTLHADHVSTSRQPGRQWQSVLQPDILSVLLVVPEQMSALDLLTYIEHLQNNHQKTQRYEIALWSKLFYPLACISMALVALAFTPAQRRQNDLGVKLFTGISLGIAFHFCNRLFGHLGLLYDWNPLLSATIPTTLFLIAGGWAILRLERR